MKVHPFNPLQCSQRFGHCPKQFLKFWTEKSISYFLMWLKVLNDPETLSLMYILKFWEQPDVSWSQVRRVQYPVYPCGYCIVASLNIPSKRVARSSNAKLKMSLRTYLPYLAWSFTARIADNGSEMRTQKRNLVLEERTRVRNYPSVPTKEHYKSKMRRYFLLWLCDLALPRWVWNFGCEENKTKQDYKL